MQFETGKEAPETGGNFYFFFPETKPKPKQQQKWGKKESAPKDNAVLPTE